MGVYRSESIHVARVVRDKKDVMDDEEIKYEDGNGNFLVEKKGSKPLSFPESEGYIGVLVDGDKRYLDLSLIKELYNMKGLEFYIEAIPGYSLYYLNTLFYSFNNSGGVAFYECLEKPGIEAEERLKIFKSNFKNLIDKDLSIQKIRDEILDYKNKIKLCKEKLQKLYRLM